MSSHDAAALWLLENDHKRGKYFKNQEISVLYRSGSAAVEALGLEALLGEQPTTPMRGEGDQCRDPFMTVDESQLPECHHEKKKKEGKSRGKGGDRGLWTESNVEWLLSLTREIKPRDKKVLELRFEQGLSVAQIAEYVGKTESAIYECFDRNKSRLRAALERQEWCDEHNDNGTGDAPVVLGKTGQLGWDLGVQK